MSDARHTTTERRTGRPASVEDRTWATPPGLAAPVSRRTVLRAGGAGIGLFLLGSVSGRAVAFEVPASALPGGTLDPAAIPKYVTPLLVPPAMPRAGVVPLTGGQNADYYEISMRQFPQQMLPGSLPATTVWGYGAVTAGSRRGLLLHNAPSLTIEAFAGRPVRVRWINDLVDTDGHHLPHLLPVDPTLHWANPPGGETGRDTRPTFHEPPEPYTGPVPIVTHVHGAVGVGDESDGYPEAWYLPDVAIPDGYAEHGTWYEFFAGKAQDGFGGAWGPGYATFQYPNLDRASTNWYHDHTLGMTRLNVYAGPAGFYIIRGGPAGDDAVVDTRTGTPAVLPGPAPRENDKFPPNKTYYEIPLAIQDRSFNEDGSLFYPDTREFFDGLVGPYLPDGEFSPIWNPEFFGNTLIVNGNTWPFLEVERRRYRFRLLNGCQSRFLILDFSAIEGAETWVVGNEGGFLDAPVDLAATSGGRLLMGPAERADVVLDLTAVPEGRYVLRNLGPDEPFGGGNPAMEDDLGDFWPADPATTGQVMELRVGPARGPDPTTPPRYLALPAAAVLPAPDRTRGLALIEMMGEGYDADGEELEGPVEALLGTVEDGVWVAREWAASVSENPALGAVEVWEFYNTTGDAHPMHVHEVAFEVLGREGLVLDEEGEVMSPATPDGNVSPPEPWETGVKDTVIAYPGQVTRVKMRFDRPGQYVWHCHIVEHEDNEMMRPFRVGPLQPDQPADGGGHTGH